MIRHLATTFDGSLLVAAQFERVVEIWDVDSCRHKITFEALFDFGGDRLAITRDGLHCVAAAVATGECVNRLPLLEMPDERVHHLPVG